MLTSLLALCAALSSPHLDGDAGTTPAAGTIAVVETVGLDDAPLQLILPDGPAVIGGPFSVRISGSAAGSQAFLALGLATQPVFSETLGFLVYPASPLLVSTAAVDAQGLSAPMLVTDRVEPELCGLAFTLQGAVAGSGTPTFSTTPALEVRAGNAPAGLLPGWILPIPLRPHDLAAGDLDGDGLDELIVVNYPSPFVPVQPPAVCVLGFPVGAEPEVLFETSGDDYFERPKLIDWNLDGRLDLTYLGTTYSATSSATLRFGVMPGLGDGSFGPAEVWDLVKSASDHALGDLDGDGVLDLVYLGSTGSGLRVRLGTGDGFGPPDFTPGIQGERGIQLFLNDLDGDGDLDLLVHQRLNLGGSRARTLANDGTGGFEEVASLQVLEKTARAVTLLERSGATDVALVFFGESSPELRLIDVGSDLSLSLGRELDLDLPSVFSAPPADLDAADIDGDGRVDLALADGLASVLLFRGREDGSFEELPRLDAVRECRSVEVLRLNTDGALDLVASANDRELTLHFGRGSVDFDRHETLPLTALPKLLGFGDLTGDGRSELVATGAAAVPGEFPFLEVLRNAGNGKFESAQVLHLPHQARDLQLADFDGDGLGDLALLRRAPSGPPTEIELVFFRGTVELPLEPLGTLDTVENASAFRLADLDSDGLHDVIVLGFVPGEGGVLALHMGRSDGGFGPPNLMTSQFNATRLEVADLDDDGDADLLLPNAFGLETWHNNGSGAFTVSSIDLGEGTIRQFVLADLDGDPHPDFVISRSSPVLSEGAQLMAFRGLPDGSFEMSAPPLSLGLWLLHTLDGGDVDGDGDWDLVLSGWAPYELSGVSNTRIEWIENSGGGVFGIRHRVLVPNIAQYSFDMVLADLDENGTLDFALARDESSGIDLFLNRLGHPIGAPPETP